jgi:hypothetical protein
VFQSKTSKLLTLLGTAMLALALLASAAQAEKPAPPYEQFAGCPNEAQSASTVFCIRSDVTGGHLNVGNKEVPIEKPLVLVGGVDEEFENFVANSEGGLSKTPQKVPGGVVGLTGLTELLELFSGEALDLYATAELAGVPTNFSFSTVTLPLKVHLTNPAGIIGSSCYDGSNSNPIVLHLTTGKTNPPPPNKSIEGKEPTISVDANEIFHLSNGIFVDNAFSAPGVNGCKLFGLLPINGLINATSGLPAAAGTNEAVNNFSIEFVARENVY